MKSVNAVQLRQSLGKVVARLQKDGEPILLQKGHRPVAVLISIEDFQERFHEKAAADQRDQVVERLRALRRSGADPTSGLAILREIRGYDD